MTMVLVVDDKEVLRDSVSATLERAGFEVQSVPDAPRPLRRRRVGGPTSSSPTCACPG